METERMGGEGRESYWTKDDRETIIEID